jgi:hypothetical protein
MASGMVTLRTNLTWYEWIAVLVVGGVGYVKGSPWSAILCALGAGIAIGVWRAVTFLGKLVEYAQLEAGVYDEEEPGAG